MKTTKNAMQYGGGKSSTGSSRNTRTSISSTGTKTTTPMKTTSISANEFNNGTKSSTVKGGGGSFSLTDKSKAKSSTGSFSNTELKKKRAK